MVLGKRSSAVFARQEAAVCTASLRRNSPAYGREIGGAAGDDVERVRRRDSGAQRRLVDPVSGDRVDEARRVADEGQASSRRRRPGRRSGSRWPRTSVSDDSGSRAAA